MSDLIQSSEDVFFRMFYDLEVLVCDTVLCRFTDCLLSHQKAFPIYHEMVHAIMSFETGDRASCIIHLENISQRLRDLFLIFFDNLKDSRVSRSVWLSYIQGFQGWGVGRVVDGQFIKYDGLSGNHVLFFQALDAFLGMNSYLSDENHNRYIPVNQRALCLALRKHSFRSIPKEHDDDFQVEGKVKLIVNQLKVGISFRPAILAH